MKRRRAACRDTLLACCTSPREGVSTQKGDTDEEDKGGRIDPHISNVNASVGTDIGSIL